MAVKLSICFRESEFDKLSSSDFADHVVEQLGSNTCTGGVMHMIDGAF